MLPKRASTFETPAASMSISSIPCILQCLMQTGHQKTTLGECARMCTDDATTATDIVAIRERAKQCVSAPTPAATPATALDQKLY